MCPRTAVASIPSDRCTGPQRSMRHRRKMRCQMPHSKRWRCLLLQERSYVLQATDELEATEWMQCVQVQSGGGWSRPLCCWLKLDVGSSPGLMRFQCVSTAARQHSPLKYRGRAHGQHCNARDRPCRRWSLWCWRARSRRSAGSRSGGPLRPPTCARPPAPCALHTHKSTHTSSLSVPTS